MIESSAINSSINGNKDYLKWKNNLDLSGTKKNNLILDIPKIKKNTAYHPKYCFDVSK